MNKNQKKLKGNIFILLAAFTWGISIVWQKEGMDYMKPFTFTACRLILGGFCLLIVSMIIDFINLKKNPNHNVISDYKNSIIPGLICAPVILATIIIQQYALRETAAGKSAFISAFYIFLVPLFGFFFGEKPSRKTWMAVFLAIIAMFIMNMTEGIKNINKGDALSFVVAIGYSVFILLGDKYSKKAEPTKFAMFQFLIAGVISFMLSPIIEPGNLSMKNIMLSRESILITAIFSTCMGYTFQLVGQKDADANEVPILLSSETLFSFLAGLIVLHEILKVNEYVGCILMSVAILISVLPERKNIFEKIKNKFIKKKGDHYAIRNF